MKEKEIKLEKDKNIIYYITIFIITLFIFNFIHELFHFIGLLFVSAKLNSLTISYTIIGPSISLKIICKNKIQIIIITITGTILSCLLATFLSFYSKTKDKLSLSVSSFGVLLNEFMYWWLAFVFQFGDSYVLMSYTSVIYVFLMFFFMVILITITLVNLFKMQ